jgi:hypothetical protein
MLKRQYPKILLLSVLLLGIGCISPKSYVDPALPKVTAVSIQREAQVVALEVRFFRNGVRYPKGDAQTLQQVRLQLYESGAVREVLPVPSPTQSLLKVDIDNVADTGNAAAKGFGTGLTFGLIGNMITDRYVFTATLERPGLPPIQKFYKHAIHTTVGNKSGPEGLEPMTSGQAYNQIIKECVFNLIKDLQDEGSF